MDRRSFTKGLLGALLASTAPLMKGTEEPSLSNAFERPGKSGESFDYDVAIVGGGISGIYTAWRLITADPRTVKLPGRPTGSSGRLKVALFEGSERIGGRLLSASSPCLSGVKCELGGMRFMSSQDRVQKLIKTLNLGTHGMETRGNIAYLRHKYLPWAALNAPNLLPYDLKDEEKQVVREQGAGNLMEWAMRSLVKGTTGLYGRPLYEHLQFYKYNNTPLYQWGFRDLLSQKLSGDAILLSQAISGFDALTENANAVDLVMESLDFAPYTKFFLLDDGFESVPWSLEGKFRKAGGKVVFKEWLQQFERLHQGPDSGVKLKFRSGLQVTTRALVLAMPRHPLKSVLQGWNIPNPDGTGDLLDSVEPIPLFKMFLLYPRAWWSKLPEHATDPICIGRSYTDTPIRQCWYWNAVSCDLSDHAAMIMVYCDMDSVKFWERKRQGPDAPACGTCEGSYQKNWCNHKVPKAMLEEVHQKLRELHGASPEEAPAPMDAAFMDWLDEPYGGAVHFWKSGYQSWKVINQMIQPLEKEKVPVYICGEAYSTNQTWVEGALETAELVLQRFGLPPLS